MSLLVSGGCLRIYTDGPEWYINSGYHANGLIDTSTDPTIDESGFIVVKLLRNTERAVVAMTAAPDETLSARGILAGCSNGGPISRIRMSKVGVGALNLNNQNHLNMVAGPNSNLWLTFVHNLED